MAHNRPPTLIRSLSEVGRVDLAMSAMGLLYPE
jgi:hypothetical protein